MNKVDYDINHYTKHELLHMVNLNIDSTVEQIKEQFAKIIKKNLKEKNIKLAQFLHEAKEKILSNDNDIQEDNTDQASKWLENLYLLDNDNNNNLPDRRQDFSLFNNPTNPVMKQKRLGIDNTIPLNISQDSLNPTLRQTIIKYVNIDSTYRANETPFQDNPFSSNGTLPTDFRVTLSEPINNALSMKLVSCYIPETWNTFDRWFSNNAFIIFTSDIKDDILKVEPNMAQLPSSVRCAKIGITEGTFKFPVQLIQQINWSLAACADLEKVGLDFKIPASPPAPAPNPPPYPPPIPNHPFKQYSKLTAHLFNPLSAAPYMFFLNTSKKWIKIIFWERANAGGNLTSGQVPIFGNTPCGDCYYGADISSCYKPPEYNNSLGYYLGFRIVANNNPNPNNDPITENDNNIPQLLEIIIPPLDIANLSVPYSKLLPPGWDPPSPPGTVPPTPISDLASINNMQFFVNSIIDNLFKHFDVSYNINTYFRDISIILNTISGNGSQIGYEYPYIKSTVPMSLFSTQYLYLCLDDFQSNRSPDNIIGVAASQTKLSMPSYATSKYARPWGTKSTVQENIELDLSAGIICASDNNNQPIFIPSWPRTLTQRQLYSVNQIASNRSQNLMPGADGSPAISNVLAIISLADHDQVQQAAAIAWGSGTQDKFAHTRHYFGPVRLERFGIKLLDQRGNLVNLNGKEWTFTLAIEELYQY